MKEIKLLTQLPTTKAEIKAFADNVVTSLMDDGFYEPLEIAIRIEAVKKIMDAIKTDQRFKDACLDHADNFPEKTFSFSGIDVTKAASTKYDYSDDEEWQRLKLLESNTIESRKDRETVLKAIKDESVIDGVKCYPPVKISSDHLRFRF